MTAEASPHRRQAFALLGFFGFVLIAPPYLSMRDGPRALIGRLYAPIFWRQWQGRTLGMVDQIHTLVDRVEPGQQVLVVTSQFEPDRYLHLRLLQEGYQIQPVAPDPACQSIETFTRGRQTVTSIRTENPYGLFHGPQSGNYLEDLQLTSSLACLRLQQFTRAYFFSIGHSGQPYWPALGAPDVTIPTSFPLPVLRKVSYAFFNSTPLSHEDLPRLDAEARRSLALLPAPTGPWTGSLNDRILHQQAMTHFWKPSP